MWTRQRATTSLGTGSRLRAGALLSVPLLLLASQGCSPTPAPVRTVLERQQGGWSRPGASHRLIAAEGAVRGKNIECLAGVVQTSVAVPEFTETYQSHDLVYVVLVRHSGHSQHPNGRITRLSLRNGETEYLHQELWFGDRRVAIDYRRNQASGEEGIQVSGQAFDLGKGRTFFVDLAEKPRRVSQVHAGLDRIRSTKTPPWRRTQWRYWNPWSYPVGPTMPGWRGSLPVNPIEEFMLLFTSDDQNAEMAQFLRSTPGREVPRPSHVAGWGERSGSFPLFTGELRFQDGTGGCVYAMVGKGDLEETRWQHAFLLLVRTGAADGSPYVREDVVVTPAQSEGWTQQKFSWTGMEALVDYRTASSPSFEALFLAGRAYDLDAGRVFLLDFTGASLRIEQLEEQLEEASFPVQQFPGASYYYCSKIVDDPGYAGWGGLLRFGEMHTLAVVKNLEANSQRVYEILGSRAGVPEPIGR